MVGDFDTYFLESDSITGPWRLANYNARFGSEAYFCNWPSKFLAKQANTTQRVYDGFLAYSANFARGISNPPHSGYHLNLQQSRFKLSPGFAAKLEQYYSLAEPVPEHSRVKADDRLAASPSFQN